jgi:hypothetical protein
MDSDTVRWVNIDIDPGSGSDVREAVGDRSESDQPTASDRVDHHRDTAQVTVLHPDHCSDDSMHVAENANVNVNRFTLPKDPREIMVAVVLALSIMVNVVMGGLYLNSQRMVADAEKDLKTQVWLRDDALTKFEQGPFADMKAHVLALEMNYKERK